MKQFLVFFFLMLVFTVKSQTIFGKWRTVDDETGEEKSVVEIYQKDGKVYGKIIEIFDASKRDLPCKYCEGEDHNMPILGLNIIKNMEQDGDVYKEGTITDPQDGKVYKGRLKLDGKNTLQVRGYVAFFYATQYWLREQE